MIVKIFRVQCSGPCGLWLSPDGPVAVGYPDISEFESSLLADWHAWAAGWIRPQRGISLFGDPEHMYCPGYRPGDKAQPHCLPVPEPRRCPQSARHIGAPGARSSAWEAAVQCPSCGVCRVWEQIGDEG